MVLCKCCKCGAELNENNWYSSQRIRNTRVCKKCNFICNKAWKKANPERVKIIRERCSRKQGHLPFYENKECAIFLGVHVAERVLSHVFKDVEIMPHGNPGYDFICNKGKLIDVKSSCLRKNKTWGFSIRHNTIADYFLCLAFDDRESFNPLYIWLIPGSVVNHLVKASTSVNMVSKWDEYLIDITKVVACCDTIKGGI